MRTKAIILISLLLPTAAAAQPHAAYSEVEPWDSYGAVAVSPNVNSLVVFVTVRDYFSDPMPGVEVRLDLLGCSNVCVTAPNDFTGTTDGDGQVTLSPHVGGCDNCTVRVFADGVLLRTYSKIVSPDWDGTQADGLVDDEDLDFFFSHFPPFPYDACADYNNDGLINTLDLALISSCHGDSSSFPCTGLPIDPVPAMREIDATQWVAVLLPALTTAGDAFTELLPQDIGMPQADSIIVYGVSGPTVNDSIVDVTSSVAISMNANTRSVSFSDAGTSFFLYTYKLPRALLPGEIIVGEGTFGGALTKIYPVNSFADYRIALEADTTNFEVDDTALLADIESYLSTVDPDDGTFPVITLYQDGSFTEANYEYSEVSHPQAAEAETDLGAKSAKVFSNNLIVGKDYAKATIGVAFFVRGCDPRNDYETADVTFSKDFVNWMGCLSVIGADIKFFSLGGSAQYDIEWKIYRTFRILPLLDGVEYVAPLDFNFRNELTSNWPEPLTCEEFKDSRSPNLVVPLEEARFYVSVITITVNTRASGGSGYADFKDYDDGTPAEPGVEYNSLSWVFHDPPLAELYTHSGYLIVIPDTVMAGDFVTTYLRIENYGPADATNVPVNVYLDAQLIDNNGDGHTYIVPYIRACDETVHPENICISGTPGPHNLTFQVDEPDPPVHPKGAVDEICEEPGATVPCEHTASDNIHITPGPAAATAVVMDKSWSMDGPGGDGPSFLEMTTAAARAYVDAQTDSTALGVILFGENVELTQRLLLMDAYGKTTAKQKVGGSGIDRTLSDLYTAISEGLDLVACAPTYIKSVLAFTDGAENRYGPCVFIYHEMIEKSIEQRTPVIIVQPSVGYEDESEDPTPCVPFAAQRDSIRAFAVQTGGALYELVDTTATTLDSLIKEIMEHLPDPLMVSPIGQPTIATTGNGQKVGAINITSRTLSQPFPSSVVITTPAGATFAGLPPIAGTNVTLGTPTLGGSNTQLTIPVSGTSCTDCSRVVHIGDLDGISLNITSVPVGWFEMTVVGDAHTATVLVAKASQQTAIPTLGELGMSALILLLLTVGILMRRRRSRQP